MDTAIINTWERRRVQEDDDAYEGRINLGPPNDVGAAGIDQGGGGGADCSGWRHVHF
jgi:hypothetical protein